MPMNGAVDAQCLAFRSSVSLNEYHEADWTRRTWVGLKDATNDDVSEIGITSVWS